MITKLRRRLEIKEISAAGTFEGILSPYGNVDNGGDVVERGAYTKTLAEGPTRPLLWQHKPDCPIGSLTLEDKADGLYCTGQLLMDLPEAKKAYLLIKAGIVKGLSIGFATVKDSVQNGVRHLNELKLYEGSIVTFPMNEAAQITAVKAARGTKSDFVDELTEIQLCDAAYQMRAALSCALSSVIWAPLTRDEKIAAAETIIEQFHDAYMAYLPRFLDMMTEEYGSDMETWAAKKLETKAGRTISAATKTKLSTAHEHMTSAADLLLSLIAEEAGSTTSDAGADGEKSEPVDHSAIALQIKKLKESFL